TEEGRRLTISDQFERSRKCKELESRGNTEPLSKTPIPILIFNHFRFAIQRFAANRIGIYSTFVDDSVMLHCGRWLTNQNLEITIEDGKF
ncbi:hypothetical protein PENTCL1PPCAC_21001, partial [Pristionchus entomophagus]